MAKNILETVVPVDTEDPQAFDAQEHDGAHGKSDGDQEPKAGGVKVDQCISEDDKLLNTAFSYQSKFYDELLDISEDNDPQSVKKVEQPQPARNSDNDSTGGVRSKTKDEEKTNEEQQITGDHQVSGEQVVKSQNPVGSLALMAVACNIAGAQTPEEKVKEVDLTWKGLWSQSSRKLLKEIAEDLLLKANGEIREHYCEHRDICINDNIRHVKFHGAPGRKCERLETFFAIFSSEHILHLYQASVMELPSKPMLPIDQVFSWTHPFEQAFQETLPMYSYHQEHGNRILMLTKEKACVSKMLFRPTSQPQNHEDHWKTNGGYKRRAGPTNGKHPRPQRGAN